MTRLGVIGHPRYERLDEVLRTVGELAPRLGLELAVEQELLSATPGAAELRSPTEIDAMLTLGGDGTFLRAARFVQGHAKPKIGRAHV